MIKRKSFNFITYALLFAFYTLICTTCYNPIMETWWPEDLGNGRSGVNFGVVQFDIGFTPKTTEGPQPKAVNIAWGNAVGRLRPISRDGMGFAGWFDETGALWNVETRPVLQQDDVNGDGVITLHAKWEVLFYTVTFEENGATPPVADQRIAYNARAVEPPPLQSGGVAQGFGGWWRLNGKDTNNWGTQWNFANDPVTNNIELYARWETTTRTVIFQPNGGMRPGILQGGNAANAEMNPTKFTIYVSPSTGGKVLDPGPLAKEGYAFDGWYTTPNFIASSLWNFSTDRIKESDSLFYDKDNNKDVLGDPFYLYAKWIPNLYLITFVADGGTPVPASQQVQYKHKITEPPVITKGEMAFRGWYTINLNGEEATTAYDAYIYNFNDEVINNVTLYAGWVPKQYTVTFHLGSPPQRTPTKAGLHSVYINAKPAVQQIRSGGKAVEPVMPALPADAAATNWSFDRWDYAPGYSGDPDDIDRTDANTDGLTAWNFNTTVPGNMTLYARWVEAAPDMIWVPRGSFVMGDSGVSGNPAAYHSYPTRRVTVDGFYISRFEITQVSRQDTNKSYFDVMGVNPSQFYRNDVRPVDRVSWYDAVMYCNKLTDLMDNPSSPSTPSPNRVYTISGESYSGNLAGTGGSGTNARPAVTSITSATVTVPDWTKRGYRLPTEAEWEYAARGGNNSPGNFTYSGSNDSTLVAWYNDTIKTGADAGSTQTVGKKQPNALGIYDMSGNITEWVWDWFDSYKSSYYFTDSTAAKPVNPTAASILNPKGPTSGTERIRRGGGWSNAVGNVRSVVRNSQDPGEATWVNGFRVVRGPGTIW